MIQRRLGSPRRATDPPNRAKIFANLVMTGQVNSALRYLSDDQGGGILPLSDDVMEQLKEKYPDPQGVQLGSLLFGPIEDVPDSMYYEINGDMVRDAALRTKGSGGPSEMPGHGGSDETTSGAVGGSVNGSGMASVALDVSGLEPFNPKGEAHNLSQRWKRWKRAFDLYVTRKGVSNDAQKRALLLHVAGMDVEEIYFTLAGDGEDVSFQATLQVLDDYFVPKSNFPFERHLFRQISQENGETAGQFVCRLRQRAATCEFGVNDDDYIQDQLIDKCYSSHLRRKFLEKEGTVTFVEQLDDHREERSALATLIIGGVYVTDVLIGLGASCNVMGQRNCELLKQKGIKCESRKSVKEIFAYGGVEPCSTLGNFTADVTQAGCGFKDGSKADFIVFEGDGRTLLGRETAGVLNLLRVGTFQANSVDGGRSDGSVRQKYKELFSGVGLLKGYELKLHVDWSVKPVAPHERRIHFGLREKVDAKLDEVLRLDIIEEVPEGPSGWMSPLVVVPKGDGDVRVCVDMRRANEAIFREQHPIPTVEELLNDWKEVPCLARLMSSGVLTRSCSARKVVTSLLSSHTESCIGTSG
ncbi:Uncharacterized protein K02A2.6 [Stylophora pistillata]|uniref:Uncharacterized protein K02A2.6 n=1 Tax=Stylophora pistillata TaxID=50429 RepID=A0A2B4R499_STYPI|nr:Uncharacterized protein K02A2.6 [Stylophora pistillata]